MADAYDSGFPESDASLDGSPRLGRPFGPAYDRILPDWEYALARWITRSWIGRKFDTCRSMAWAEGMLRHGVFTREFLIDSCGVEAMRPRSQRLPRKNPRPAR